jgi:hypothetical protein
MDALPGNFPPPADSLILGVLQERSRRADYPLEPEDVERHLDLLTSLVKEKIGTLAGLNDHTRMTVAEALNHVMMSPRWLKRNVPKE